MNQKHPSKGDLIALGDETFDRMEGDPELIEMMRALWRINIELQFESLETDVPEVLH